MAPHHLFINPIFSGSYHLSNKNFGTPPPKCLNFWKVVPTFNMAEGGVPTMWAATSWPLTVGPFVPRKKPNRAKGNYSFHWKLKRDRALVLTDLDRQMARFFFRITLFDFRHLHELNWGQSWTKNSNFGHVMHSVLQTIIFPTIGEAMILLSI